MSLAAVYITAPDRETAQKIGRALLEKRHVACVNIFDNATSMYWWEGEIQTDSEVVMIAKTQMRKVNDCIKTVSEIHPYDVPCVTALPVLKANRDYLNWVIETTDQE